eukprot:c15096_g1_i1 orf=163-540(+)
MHSFSLHLGLRSEVLGSRFIELNAANRRGIEKPTNRIDPVGHKGWEAQSICCRKRDLDDFPGRSYPDYGSLVADVGDSKIWQCPRKEEDLGDFRGRSLAHNGSLLPLYSIGSVANSVDLVSQRRR